MLNSFGTGISTKKVVLHERKQTVQPSTQAIHTLSPRIVVSEARQMLANDTQSFHNSFLGHKVKNPPIIGTAGLRAVLEDGAKTMQHASLSVTGK